MNMKVIEFVASINKITESSISIAPDIALSSVLKAGRLAPALASIPPILKDD